MKHTTAETMVINLRLLLDKTGWTVGELSARSKVSKRMIDYILSGERGSSIEIADKLASAFGITGWQLIMPSLPYDLVKSGQLDKLISDYAHCPEPARNYISMVAERDAEYKVVNGD